MAGFNPSEPRVPAGSAAGGTWGGGGAAPAASSSRSAAAKKAAATRAAKKGAAAPAKAPAKAPAGGWHGGKARDAAAQGVQNDAAAQKLYDALTGLPAGKQAAYAKGLSDADLEKLTGAIYSERTSDPAIVRARVVVANEMSKRGIPVTKYGAKGGGIGGSKPSAPAAPVRRGPIHPASVARTKAAAAKPAAKAAPAPAPRPFAGGAPTGQQQYGRTRAI